MRFLVGLLALVLAAVGWRLLLDFCEALNTLTEREPPSRERSVRVHIVGDPSRLTESPALRHLRTFGRGRP